MKVPIEIKVCKEWIERWDKIDKPLLEIAKKARDTKHKWSYLFGNIIHDGRQNQTKLKLALSKDYDDVVRHKIWITFSHFVVFAEYILDMEK